MYKFIIYGVGKVFYELQNKFPWTQIIALADKKIVQHELYHNIDIVNPEKINEYTYDYLVVCSGKFFDEIKEELIAEFSVPEYKIISYKMLVGVQTQAEKEAIFFFRDFIRENNCRLIWDADMRLFPQYYFNKKALWDSADVNLVASREIETLIYKNLYTYSEEIVDIKNCDTVFFGEQLELYKKILLRCGNEVKYLLGYLPCNRAGLAKLKYINELLEQGKKIQFISKIDLIFIIIDLRSPKILHDTTIYVATHKEYCVKCNALYQPICVGNQYENINYLSEHIGDNISYLNEKINECTALYWIWKNSTKKYVGLNHYRRYFCNNGLVYRDNLLDEYRIEEVLKEYDIILAETIPLFNLTEFEQIRNSISDEAFENGLQLVRRGITIYQPDYINQFERVMKGHNAYLYNMFVTRKEILDAYCEWLFSFLIDVAEQIDVSKYDSYSKRVIGFFAERMWTVWLMKQDIKIKELPHIMTK